MTWHALVYQYSTTSPVLPKDGCTIMAQSHKAILATSQSVHRLCDIYKVTSTTITLH